MSNQLAYEIWPDEQLNIGVINPYALAELVAKDRIDWGKVKEPEKVLEEVLNFRYEDLFDPNTGSPLYLGVHFSNDTWMEPASENSLVNEIAPYVAEPHLVAPYAVLEKAPTRVREMTLRGTNGDYTPPGAQWNDPGTFFAEAAEMTDPVQGALGDCYFIAALVSVAWANTYKIAHRTRAIGYNNPQFVDMIEFFDGGKSYFVEVTEQLPLAGSGNFIYARSSEAGEIWPAVYEKAYAKWKTQNSGDKPEYPKIAGGDPVRAAAELTGLRRYYYVTKSMDEAEIWKTIRENSVSCKTFHPMVAWTYSSADAAPTPINYSSAHLAANHAYSVLGWQWVNNSNYVILRNPWGCYESTLNVDGSIWVTYDAPYYSGPGWWRQVEMPKDDGIFALRLDTFKQYFAGFGLVK